MLCLCLCVELLVYDAIGARQLLRTQPFGVDFLPMWTAAQSLGTPGGPALYDMGAISRAQDWLLGSSHKVRPWMYPPSALLILAPFGRLGYWTSAFAWTATSLGVSAAAAKVTRTPNVALALAWSLPATVTVLLAGQITLIISGLCLLGLHHAHRRPIIAGVLFGIAGALKPSSVLMIPIVLVALGAFRALAASGVLVAALALISAALFGMATWSEWFHALAGFSALVFADPTFVARMITPVSLAHLLTTRGDMIEAVQIASLFIGAGFAWTLAKRNKLYWALIAIFGGGLFASPYAMQYDAASLALPLAAFVAQARSRLSLGLSVSAFALLACTIIAGFGAIAITVLLTALLFSATLTEPQQTVELKIP